MVCHGANKQVIYKSNTLLSIKTHCIEIQLYLIAESYSDIKEEDMDKPHVYYNEGREAGERPISSVYDPVAISPNTASPVDKQPSEGEYTSLQK